MQAKRNVIDMTRKNKNKPIKKNNEEVKTVTLTSMFQKIKKDSWPSKSENESGSNAEEEAKDSTKSTEIDEFQKTSSTSQPNPDPLPDITMENNESADVVKPKIYNEKLPIIINEDYVPKRLTSDIKVEEDDFKIQDEEENQIEINNSQILDALSDEEGGFAEGEQVNLLNSKFDTELTSIDNENRDEFKDIKKMEMYVFTDKQFIVCQPPIREEESKRTTLILKLPEDGGESPVRPKILLKGLWSKTPIDENDIVRVIGTFWRENDFTLFLEEDYVEETMKYKSDINYAEYIILEPAIMISSTVIISSFPWVRRGVFSELFKSASLEKRSNMVLGNLVHSTFEKFLSRIDEKVHSMKQFGEHTVKEIVNEALSSQIVSLHQVGETEEHAKEFLVKSVKSIIRWLEDILNPMYKEFSLKLHSCVGTEQEYQSEKYGFRGKIDSILYWNDKKSEQNVFSVLELKTGKKESGSHRAQVILYSLLISERFLERASKNNMLLYIMKTGKTHFIKAMRSELWALIQRRNELAKLQKLWNLGKPIILPPMLKKEQECESCYANMQCSMYALSIENIEESSFIPRFPTFTTSKNKMWKASRDYFKKWFEIISIEQSAANSVNSFKSKRNLPKEENLRMWYISPISSSCSSANNVIIKLQKPINGYIKLSEFCEGMYTNVTSSHWAIYSKGVIVKKHITQLDSDIFPAKKIKIEYENAPKSESKNEWMVRMDELEEDKDDLEQEQKELDKLAVAKDEIVKGKIPKGRKALEYIIEFRGVNRLNFESESLGGRNPKDLIWKLETEGTNTYIFNIMRNWLYQILMKPEFSKPKEYIVLSHPPKYEDDECSNRYSKIFSTYLEDLNDWQQKAIIRSLTAKDFQCILSLPASGELIVIERIARWATILKKKVLIMAYNHSVIDSTLINIREKQPDLRWFRLNTDSNECDLRLKNITRNGNTWKNMNELKELIDNTDIFWTTTLSMFHPFLLGLTQKFDYVIVQEASLINEPVWIGPALLGKTLVMFGDYYILNPSAKSPEADRKGLGVSLFRRLWELHQKHVVVMKKQYRMNRDIWKLSNSVAYSGLIQHGSLAIKDSQLEYSEDVKAPLPWINEVKSPSRSVIFVNTDNLLKKTMPQDISAMKTKNYYEAAIIKGLILAFIDSGVKQKEIAVVSPLLNNTFMLQKHLRSEKIKWVGIERCVEISRDIVIVSWVKWWKNFLNLKDIRRLYLAFIRAKKKLIIVGSKMNLMQVDPINKFIRYIDMKNWYIEINNLQQIQRYIPAEAKRVMSRLSKISEKDKGDSKVIVKQQSLEKDEYQS